MSQCTTGCSRSRSSSATSSRRRAAECTATARASGSGPTVTVALGTAIPWEGKIHNRAQGGAPLRSGTDGRPRPSRPWAGGSRSVSSRPPPVTLSARRVGMIASAVMPTPRRNRCIDVISSLRRLHLARCRQPGTRRLADLRLFPPRGTPVRDRGRRRPGVRYCFLPTVTETGSGPSSPGSRKTTDATAPP